MYKYVHFNYKNTLRVGLWPTLRWSTGTFRASIDGLETQSAGQSVSQSVSQLVGWLLSSINELVHVPKPTFRLPVGIRLRSSPMAMIVLELAAKRVPVGPAIGSCAVHLVIGEIARV